MAESVCVMLELTELSTNIAAIEWRRLVAYHGLSGRRLRLSALFLALHSASWNDAQRFMVSFKRTTKGSFLML